MIDKNYKFGVKRLLNKEHFHSVAAVSVMIHNDYSHPGGSMDISDCNNVIKLSLDFDGVGEIDNTIHKIRTLMDVCRITLSHIEGNKNNYLEAVEERNKKYEQKEV